MRRPLTAAVAVLTLAGLAASVPAEAAKKRPKPITGSYTVTLPPDPSGNVDGVGCAGQLPAGEDRHAFTIPAKGTLKLHLSGVDPVGSGLDWDLGLLDAGGNAIALSTGGTSEEEILQKFKRKEAVLFQACNLTGLPEATITYTFTYA